MLGAVLLWSLPVFARHCQKRRLFSKLALSPMSDSARPIVIRPASASDLPAVQSLIRESYGAMSDHLPTMAAMFASGAEAAITRHVQLM